MGLAGDLLSFLDLIDALVIGQLRDTGVSLQYLRKVYQPLVEELRTDHPFARKNVFTDKKSVFLHVADEMGEDSLKEMLTRQQSFAPVLMPYLERIEWDPATLLAARWHVYEGVIVDPQRRYGKPIVADSGVPTAILAASYDANNQDAEVVADWYGTSVDEVVRAVEFEREHMGRAA